MSRPRLRLGWLAPGIAALMAAGPGRADTLPGPLVAEVIQVVDGDTLEVRVAIWLDQSVTTRVRLSGIDTPERRGRCAREAELAAEATRRLRELVAAGRVRLRDVSHDKYGGRVRARVETDAGIDVADVLIAGGLARPYDGGARRSWCDG